MMSEKAEYNTYTQNPIYFSKVSIIENIESELIGKINENHQKFVLAINRFFNDFKNIIDVTDVDGYTATWGDIITYNPTKLPLIYLFGGMVYRTISDFYAADNEKIENYAPLSGDYDAIIGTKDKIFYPQKEINHEQLNQYTKIAELYKPYVFKSTDIFKDNEYLRGESIKNEYICHDRLCDNIFIKNELSSGLKNVFEKVLDDIADALVSAGIDLSHPLENKIDQYFIKFAQSTKTNLNLAVYLAAMCNTKNHIDLHFRVAFYDTKNNKHYHIFEGQIYENFSNRDILDGYVVKDESGKYKKLKLYHLIHPDYEIPIISPTNLIITQTRTLYNRAERRKTKNIKKCRKDYMRIKYLCTFFYNHNNLLPDDDSKNFLRECNSSYKQLLQVKNIISRCTNITNLPLYQGKGDSKLTTEETNKSFYAANSNYRFSDLDNMKISDRSRLEKYLEINDLENFGYQKYETSKKPLKSDYSGSKNELWRSSRTTPSKEESWRSTKTTPSKEEPWRSSRVTRAKEESWRSTKTTPSKEESWRSNKTTPSKEEPWRSSRVTRAKEESWRSTGTTPSREESWKSTGTTPIIEVESWRSTKTNPSKNTSQWKQSTTKNITPSTSYGKNIYESLNNSMNGGQKIMQY
ncbi:p87 [Tupanvirus deep ocean]|uniref:P87 n=2 Tax=Tupanvirus TaxID=2094720 RepID=A0AC62AAH6_9VIRU|nr:p87 [Tupanvirus deep ocean]QKU34650.1 p87 [Tupanvirus deep ocean]